MRRFGDLVVGEERWSERVRLSEDEIVAFAREFDPQIFHTDRAAARKSPFGDLIASGVHLLALGRRLDHVINGDIAFHCGLAFEDVRFRRAVRPDDTVMLHTRLVSLTVSRTIVDSGIATFEHRLHDQDDLLVLSWRVVALVHR